MSVGFPLSDSLDMEFDPGAGVNAPIAWFIPIFEASFDFLGDIGVDFVFGFHTGFRYKSDRDSAIGVEDNSLEPFFCGPVMSGDIFAGDGTQIYAKVWG